MSLLKMCELLEQSRLATFIRDSQVLFPVIESIHLIALAILGGLVLVIDLRLCGVGLVDSRPSDMYAQTRRWFWTALGTMLVTGVLLFVSEAVKCYYSTPFWIKMGCLIAVIVYTLTARATAIRRDLIRTSPAFTLAIALVSMLLWFGVAWGGRWIGFSG